MYGLLLEAIYDFVKTQMSEDTWTEILLISGTKESNFVTHGCYGEEILPQLAEAAARVTGLDVDELMENFAAHFVTFVSNFGYDKILRVLGRTMRDFLNGLDNLHEYMRLSYPKMQAPSFFCDNETPTSLMLHYRSRRRGYIHYVIGENNTNYLYSNIDNIRDDNDNYLIALTS
jgi:guanylate cyclase